MSPNSTNPHPTNHRIPEIVAILLLALIAPARAFAQGASCNQSLPASVGSWMGIGIPCDPSIQILENTTDHGPVSIASTTIDTTGITFTSPIYAFWDVTQSLADNTAYSVYIVAPTLAFITPHVFGSPDPGMSGDISGFFQAQGPGIYYIEINNTVGPVGDVTLLNWRLQFPKSPPTLQTEFGDDFVPGLYGTDWVFYFRDAGQDLYISPPLAAPPPLDTGLWFKTLSSGTLTITGAARNYTGESTAAPALVPLVGGAGGKKNFLGHPFSSFAPWPNVNVFDGASTVSLATAEGNGWMSKNMWKWNGSAYQVFDTVTPGFEGQLNAWDGFWVSVVSPGLSLEIPPPMPVAGRVSPASPRPCRAPGEWGVRLVAESGSLRDPGNALGELLTAEFGLDGHDLDEPAPFGDSFLTVVFPHPDWNGREPDFTTDFREPSPRAGERRWDFEVRTSRVGQPVTLRWEEIDGLDAPPGPSILVDLAAGLRTPVRPGETYTFVPSETTRAFSWITTVPALDRPGAGNVGGSDAK